jgi:uncharacterized protein (TIGR00269 family)
MTFRNPAMKCRACEQRASIHMPQHKLIFCREHFLEWMLAQTARFIKKYQMFPPGARLLAAVSGGKDSLSLWDALWRLGCAVDGLYLHLGIGGEAGYSDASEQAARRFAGERGLALYVIPVQQAYGESVPQMAARTHRGRLRPCSVCGLVKRYLMNRYALEHGYDALVTGHNLDDEVGVLYGNVLAWQMDLLRRQAPVLQGGEGFVRKAKPFCRFYERETAAYALLRGIDYIEDECPFAEGSTLLENKEALNRLESLHPGMKLHFYSGFLNARAQMFGSSGTGLAEGEESGGMKRCPTCGQPTQAAGKCAWCKLVNP